MPTRQEVANELNKLQSGGATEQQIVDYVAASGYKPDDFNVDMNGSFRPLTLGTGTATQNYSAAELKESNQYYDNLASSASATSAPATATVTGTGTGTVTGTVRTTTVTETQTTSFQQSTGGGTSTVYSNPATPTAASLSYQAEAKTASDLQSAYALNPDSKFGRSALDKRLADGRLTEEQYNDIVNSTPEQRKEKSLAYFDQYEQARTKEIAAQTGGTPTVVVTTPQNTSEVSTTYNKTVTTEVTKINGDVPGSPNISTQSVDGVQYQVVNNEDGTQSFTPVDSPYGESDTIQEEYDVLTEPPGTEVDEFGNLDATIAANENALQEPPALSDEEVNDYFTQLQDEQIENYDSTADETEDPGVYFENNGEASVSQTFYENDGTPSYAAAQGLSGPEQNTRSQATQQDVANFKQKEDWRVRLSLAPGATYLYKDKQNAGILGPLEATDGVIFPYTPTINVNYAASYEPTEITHSNYKIFQYKSSSVDNVQITCEFTAQDTFEANYLLAVIHFFRSVTKMFYGQDQNPKPGTPPPLCYLSGLGAFQFDAHPLAITAFNYSLPNDVDYIRAGSVTTPAGVNQAPENPAKSGSLLSSVLNRLSGAGLNPGALSSQPQFKATSFGGTKEPTYVPTKMQISITAIPIVTRNDISNKFSLRDYGSGTLLRGTKRQGGGIW